MDYGKKVLIVDADTSANASSAIGRSEEPVMDFAEMLLEYNTDPTTIGEITDAICPTNVEGIDIIPCTDKAAYIRASKLMGTDSDNGLFYFKDCLEQIEDAYYYIIIDVGAGHYDLNPLAANALNCSDAVLIPFFADAFDIAGLSEVIKSAGRRRSNPNLKVAGVFLNRYKETDSLQRFVKEQAPTAVGDAFIPVTVRDSAEVANAVLNGKPLCYYRPKNAVVQDFRDLTAAIIERLEAM